MDTLLLQVLSTGVTFEDGHSYHFVGSSAGQLRERTAVMLRCSSNEEAMALINRWGNFRAINNVAKLYKRLGLMFSGGAFNLPQYCTGVSCRHLGAGVVLLHWLNQGRGTGCFLGAPGDPDGLLRVLQLVQPEQAARQRSLWL